MYVYMFFKEYGDTFKMWLDKYFLNSWYYDFEKHENVLTKCSCNLWVLNVNCNLQITCGCSTLHLWKNYPILNYFALSAMFSFRQTIIIFSLQHPGSRFLIFVTRRLWNYSMRVFQVRFPSFLLLTIEIRRY